MIAVTKGGIDDKVPDLALTLNPPDTGTRSGF